MSATDEHNKIDYKSSGVHYDLLDPFKINAQKSASETDGNIDYLQLKEVPESRGESAFLMETGDGFIAHVEETLGTKNLIADAMYPITGKSYYDNIALDTIGAIVNDLITMGALPVSLAMHLAVGDSHWFEDEQRQNDLLKGWKHGCDISSALWAGGETPTLEGIVKKDTVLLSGSAVGVIHDKKNVIRSENLQDGDRIILLESSGIHANGASLCRSISKKLHDGYETKMSDGRMFGDAILDPSVIYVPIIKDCIDQNIHIHYASHLTGHGWRKIMRATESLAYIIERIPDPPSIFGFLQEHSKLNDSEMYATFNMGAGFALYISAKDVEGVLEICKKNNIGAIDAGYIENAKEKKLSIVPKNLEYGRESLSVR